MRHIFVFVVVVTVLTPSSTSFVFAQTAEDIPVNPPPAPSASAEELQLRYSIDEKTKTLQEINKQIIETQNNITDNEKDQRSLSQEIRNFDYRARQLQLGIQSSEISIDKLTLEIQSLHYDINQKEHSIDIKKEAVAKFLRELQKRSHENLLVVFLKNKSLAESFRESQSLLSLNENLLIEVDNLRNLRVSLAEDLNSASEKKVSVKKEYQNLTYRKKITEDQKKERSTLLAQTRNQEEEYQKILSALEEKQLAIGEEIGGIEDELRAKFDVSLLPAKRPGVFKNPVPGSRISQGYGGTKFAKRAYRSKFHNGIDFAAPTGTPILAARDGVVSAVGNNGKFQYGRYVVLEHDNGLMTLYAHMSRQAVAEGQEVTAGEIIGYIGNTGYSFGSHLHFTVYYGRSFFLKSLSTCTCGLIPFGVTVDPNDYL